MKKDRKTVGVVESAVSAHNPSPAVLFEARSLDLELQSPQCSWDALIAQIASFREHYPAIMLRSPSAIEALGEACLNGSRRAEALRDRMRCSATLVDLLNTVVTESTREGSATLPEAIPRTLKQLVAGMSESEELCSSHAHLFVPLLELGKQVVLVGDEGNPPEAWFLLLGRVSGLLLQIVRTRIKGEPYYDGRWDDAGLAESLEVHLLDRVRLERIEADLAWLAELEMDLNAGRRPAVDIFLELDAYEHRDERSAAWREWFERLSSKVASSGIEPRTLRLLCLGFADWIRQAHDRGFLTSLAERLRRDAPAVAAANGEAGLITALDTFGFAIVERLESEAGRGEIDRAAEDLQTVVARIIETLAESGDGSVLARATDEAARLRTGPLTGAPFSRQDAIFRMLLLVRYPHLAKSLLFSLLAGFSLEECMLRDLAPGQDDRQPADDTDRVKTVGQALCELLQHEWPVEFLHSVRAVLRVTPLSPFHLGGPTVRAHLLALDPGNRSGFYLHDMKERVLSRPGREEFEAVESVLRFWMNGDASCLRSFVEPESTASLAADLESGLIDSLRRILENLRRHAPVDDKSGVGWLANMPDAFYEASTLKKVAGFPGCDERGFSQLVHLLNIYRSLARKHGATVGHELDPGQAPGSLVDHAWNLIERRARLQRKIFGTNPRKDSGSLECLDLFAEDLSLMREAESILEKLTGLSLGEHREDLELNTGVLACLLMNAARSGLCPVEFEGMAEKLHLNDVELEDLAGVLRRIAWLSASERNALAAGIQAHVEQSVRRLLNNPLSHPAESYAELFEAHKRRGPEGLSIELSHVLVDDLLAADGGLSLLDDFAHRLLHYLERYGGFKR